jgi:hypothetical protein
MTAVAVLYFTEQLNDQQLMSVLSFSGYFGSFIVHVSHLQKQESQRE